MMMKKTLIAAAAAAAAASAVPASAQTMDEMRQELKRLRAEVEELKKQKAAPAPAPAPAADTSGWGDRIEALELKQKDAVVLGDIGGGGGFRLPGSETSVRIYGFVEGDVIHDFKATAPNDNFTNLAQQPLNGSNATKGLTKLTAETSRFGFETSTPTAYGAFTTKLEGDFYSFGDGTTRNRLRIRHAYGEYDGFLIGQTWGTFMDVDDLPETVDFNGPIGSPFVRKTMVRYTYKAPALGNFTVAIEDPATGARYPDLVARYDRSYDWGAVNLRWLTHEKRDASDGAGFHKRGYGFGIGGSFKASEKDLLMMQLAKVDGDVDNQYGSNGWVANSNDPSLPANGFAFDRNYGLIVGWTRTQNTNWRGTIAFGMNRSVASDEFKDLIGRDVGNRSLYQLHLNVFYTPIKNVDLGAEYIYGRRETYDDQTGTMSRVNFLGRYTF